MLINRKEINMEISYTVQLYEMNSCGNLVMSTTKDSRTRGLNYHQSEQFKKLLEEQYKLFKIECRDEDYNLLSVYYRKAYLSDKIIKRIKNRQKRFLKEEK